MNTALGVITDATTDNRAAIALVWIVIGFGVFMLISPRARRTFRQIAAVAVLAFREGLRQKVLWTVLALAFIPGLLAYGSDADGTHAGRARLILTFCIGAGEVLGAGLVVLLCALSVSREIESRVMHTFGVKPIRRWAILLGKAIGFWCIDLLFVALLVVFTGTLVRLVPLRAESRAPTGLAISGGWDELRQNALTTRVFHYAEGEDSAKSRFRLVQPGKVGTWQFALTPEMLHPTEPVALRLQLTSTQMFAAHIDGVTIRVFGEGPVAPFYEMTARVPQDKPFDIFLDRSKINAPTKLRVEVVNPIPVNPKGRSASMVAAAKIGEAKDGLVGNLAKAFVLMALQGWLLALVTTCWSGVLSFPITAALGLLLVIGGELSRHALDLMQSSAQRGEMLGTAAAAPDGFSGVLAAILQMLPDFRAAGGPGVFIDGNYTSGLVLAQAVLMMGLVRGLGWALPGILLFARREVGR